MWEGPVEVGQSAIGTAAVIFRTSLYIPNPIIQLPHVFPMFVRVSRLTIKVIANKVDYKIRAIPLAAL